MKKSFYLFCDSLSIIDKLTDEQNGKLLKMMRSYHNGENYAPNDFVVEIAFEQFKNQFDRDLETYNNVCERNSLNGAKGGRPRKNQENPSGYLGTQGNPEKPKKADKDKDTDKDKDNKNIIDSLDFISDDAKELFIAFVDIRKKREKGLSDIAIKNLHKELHKLSTDPIMQGNIINKSITNNWKGLFQIKHEGPQTQEDYIKVFKEIGLLQFRKKYGQEKANEIMQIAI